MWKFYLFQDILLEKKISIYKHNVFKSIDVPSYIIFYDSYIFIIFLSFFFLFLSLSLPFSRSLLYAIQTDIVRDN